MKISSKDILKDTLIAYPWNLSPELIQRISWRISLEDILWTYPLNLSAGLILNSRISRISQDKPVYPDLS
jgi:hypothetical protein